MKDVGRFSRILNFFEGNDIDDPFIKSLSLDSPLESLKSEMNMSGYIASV